MDKRHALGESGEARAAVWLKRRGWRIIARRWRCRAGEIDLIGVDEDVLVFVEVKTRSSALFGAPEEAVGARKRARMARAASFYLHTRGKSRERARFDVVAVEGDSIRHIPDAFSADGSL